MKQTLLPEDLKSGKMDLFAGSEPREFFSLLLGKDSNDQPPQASLGTSNTT